MESLKATPTLLPRRTFQEWVVVTLYGPGLLTDRRARPAPRTDPGGPVSGNVPTGVNGGDFLLK